MEQALVALRQVQANKDVVLAAVEQDCGALEYAATTPMCGQMLFAGEAMAPAISTAPRFGPKKDGNDMVMLMVRQLGRCSGQRH